MKNKPFFIIATFIVISIWAIASIIHSLSSVSVSSKLQDTLDPLSGGFDQDTLRQIQARTATRLQTQSNQPLPSTTPASPSASPSALPSTLPTASSSGSSI